MLSVPLRPRVPCGRVCTGTLKDADTAPLTSKFVEMAGYAPASFHDLMDDEVESDGSSINDVVVHGYPLSRECAMANAPGQPPVVAESLQTHTPPDPHPEALTRSRAWQGVTTKVVEPAATYADALGAARCATRA